MKLSEQGVALTADPGNPGPDLGGCHCFRTPAR